MQQGRDRHPFRKIVTRLVPAAPVASGPRHKKKAPFPGLSLYSGGRIRTCDLRVMSPTSYLAAPPRGGLWMVATVGRLGEGWRRFAQATSRLRRALECRPHVGGLQKGRGDRRRHQLGAAAGRRRRRGPGVAGRAAQHGDAAGPGGRPLRPALGRGDRGRLRGDRRATSPSSRSWARRRSTRSRPAPSATPRTAAPSSPSCASGSRSRPGSSTARRRRGSPTSAPPRSSRRASRPW